MLTSIAGVFLFFCATIIVSVTFSTILWYVLIRSVDKTEKMK